MTLLPDRINCLFLGESNKPVTTNQMEESKKSGMPVFTKIAIGINVLLFGITGIYYLANNSIVKAQDIISELILALDMDAGDFSNNLLSIYSFLNTRLIDANMRKDVEPLKFVQRMVSELREAWTQITRNSPNPNLDEMKKGGGIDVAG